MRASLNAGRGDRPKLTVLPFIIVAICRSLREFPMLNARYDDEAGVVLRSGTVNLGMATQTDGGLMVPVIRNAQDRNVWQLANEIVRLSVKARDGQISPGEMQDGTITLTSLGPLGGIATTPVVNRPQVAIIGPNRIVDRPVFEGDRIGRAKLMNLSISCDHRVVDGHDAASYVQALKRFLETPVLLFAGSHGARAMRGGEPTELVLQADSSANLLCRLIGFLAQHDIRAPELRLENHGHVMCVHLCISGLPRAELLRVAEKMRNCVGVERVDFH